MQQDHEKKGRPIFRSLVNKFILIIGLIGFCLSFSTNAAAGIFNEYQVKAVFLYNLTHFITWPETAFQGDDAPFIVGIMGENPFGDMLQKVLEKERVNGRPIVLILYIDCEQLQQRPCHMLFLADPKDLFYPNLMLTARSSHILTISDVPGFVQKGGVINLVRSNRRIEIEINQQEAKRTGVEISAQLLNLAKVY